MELFLELLETPYDPQIHGTPTAQKAINFYRECMDIDRREQVGVYPLLKMLNAIGGWPMISRNWDEAGFNWLKSYIFLRSQLGTNYIFKIYVDLDVMNTSQRVIYVSIDYSFHSADQLKSSKSDGNQIDILSILITDDNLYFASQFSIKLKRSA